MPETGGSPLTQRTSADSLCVAIDHSLIEQMMNITTQDFHAGPLRVRPAHFAPLVKAFAEPGAPVHSWPDETRHVRAQDGVA